MGGNAIGRAALQSQTPYDLEGEPPMTFVTRRPKSLPGSMR
jgi:hypothetical protein